MFQNFSSTSGFWMWILEWQNQWNLMSLRTILPLSKSVQSFKLEFLVLFRDFSWMMKKPTKSRKHFKSLIKQETESFLKLNLLKAWKILWEPLERMLFRSVEVILIGLNTSTSLILTILVPSTSRNSEQAVKIVSMLLMKETLTKSLTFWTTTKLER